MDLLVTHLDTYSRLGIPKLHHLVAFEAEDEVEEGIVYFCNGQTTLRNQIGFILLGSG